MHTAAAVNIPVIAFFGSTVKEFGFTPYNSKNLILENNSLSCRPCTHIGRDSCPEKHFKCMEEITPQSAFEKLSLILN
jgi:heptosyltransferase-2